MDTDETAHASSGWITAIAFACAAAVAIQVVRLGADFPDGRLGWPLRNAGLFVLPFLAAYFAHRRGLGIRGWLLTAAPFALAALAVNLYPYPADSQTALLTALHLPVALWFAVAYPYTGGTIGSHQRRMDFVRFTGEWVVYYALIALGGAVFVGLTAAILEPIQPNLGERVIEWVVPSGAAGAVVVAAWLVESTQQAVKNLASALAVIFTPLFAVMLTVAVAAYAVSGVAAAFDRELLGIFDAVMVVVAGLVLYALSTRDASRPPGLIDHVQLPAVLSALVLDGLVLGAMVARVGDLGFTPNRAAALGLNLVLFVNLAGTAWLSVGLLTGRGNFDRLERWQTAYLPVYAVWAAAVVAVLPPLFAFR